METANFQSKAALLAAALAGRRSGGDLTAVLARARVKGRLAQDLTTLAEAAFFETHPRLALRIDQAEAEAAFQRAARRLGVQTARPRPGLAALLGGALRALISGLALLALLLLWIWAQRGALLP